MALCRYTADDGELLKVRLVELNSTATPTDRFMTAATT